MAQELKLGTRLGMHLTQQQLRFVELLEMTAPELDEAVERELEDNPALEVADVRQEGERWGADETPYYLRRVNQGGGEERSDFIPPDNSESLYDVLLTQIQQRQLDPDVASMAEYIAGNLDSNGYLRRPLHAIVEDLAYNRGIEVAPEVAFSMRHSHKIISALHLGREEVDEANALILRLNPKPGAAYGGVDVTAAGVIVPDYNVTREGGELFISLNNRIPELAVEESFAEAMRGMELRRGRPKKGTEFVRDRYKSAVDFLNVLRQRQQTMLGIMTAIVAHQREYFETGDVYSLRPMMLKDLEVATGYDKSVISRATNNKYVSMPWGAVLPMRSFFSDAVVAVGRRGGDASGADEGDAADGGTGISSGDALTNRQIEAAIEELVDGEDKRRPLSDEKLRGELLKRGYDVSRRTVAKYRDRKGILVARLRKKF